MILAFILYGVGTLIFIVFSVVILYHLLRFGFMGDATRIMAVIFAVVAVGLIAFATYYLIHLDLPNGTGLLPSSNSTPQLPILGK